MLTEIYIEALLADEDLADQVWELWDAAYILDEVVAWAWSLIQVEAIQEIVASRREALALRAV